MTGYIYLLPLLICIEQKSPESFFLSLTFLHPLQTRAFERDELEVSIHYCVLVGRADRRAQSPEVGKLLFWVIMKHQKKSEQLAKSVNRPLDPFVALEIATLNRTYQTNGNYF